MHWCEFVWELYYSLFTAKEEWKLAENSSKQPALDTTKDLQTLIDEAYQKGYHDGWVNAFNEVVERTTLYLEQTKSQYVHDLLKTVSVPEPPTAVNLCVKISDLGLSIQYVNALRRRDVHTVADLVSVSKKELLHNYRCIGKKGVEQISVAMAACGYPLADM